MTTLEHREDLPPGFLEAGARDLHHILSGPTLIDLPGERGDTLFVSLLQHGNEDTGLRAVQRLLAAYGDQPLPRPLTLFVANPMAAREGYRRLDGQPDLNRCWPGTEMAANAATELLADVVARMQDRPLFASVDIHNTSGRNPVYACVNILDDTCLQLAARFSRTIVYFTRPRGLQAQAFLGLCPAVVLECGRPGDEAGIEAAHAYLEDLMSLQALPPGRPPAASMDLLRSVGVVHIPHSVRFSFEENDADAELALDPELDRLNFRELPAGTPFGYASNGSWPVRMVGPAGTEIADTFFEVSDGALRLRRSATPSLLTLDPRIIRQDCLCHLMEAFTPDAA